MMCTRMNFPFSSKAFAQLMAKRINSPPSKFEVVADRTGNGSIWLVGKDFVPWKKKLDLGTPSKLRLKHSSSFATAAASKQTNKSIRLRKYIFQCSKSASVSSWCWCCCLLTDETDLFWKSLFWSFLWSVLSWPTLFPLFVHCFLSLESWQIYYCAEICCCSASAVHQPLFSVKTVFLAK